LGVSSAAAASGAGSDSSATSALVSFFGAESFFLSESAAVSATSASALVSSTISRVDVCFLKMLLKTFSKNESFLCLISLSFVGAWSDSSASAASVDCALASVSSACTSASRKFH